MQSGSAPVPITARVADDRRMPGIDGTAFACLIAAASFVGGGALGAFGLVATLVASSLCGAVLAWLLRERCVIVATVLVAWCLAYAPGSAAALSTGLVTADADIVRLAFAVAIGFVVVTSLVGGAVEIAAVRRWGRAPAPIDAAPRVAATYALAGLAVAAGISAFSAGTWTYYGAKDSGGVGEFRLDYLYQPLLGAMFLLSVRRLSAGTIGGRRWAWAGVLATSSVFLFLLQSRRIMLGCVVLGVLTYLSGEGKRHAEFSLAPSPLRTAGRQRVLVLLGAAIVAAGLLYGSYFWRIASSEQGTGDAFTLADGAITHAQGASGGASLVAESTQARLTYLETDSIAIQYLYDAPFLPSFGDLLIAQGVVAIPGLLLPGKYSVQSLTCETGFAHLGLHDDMGCTPTNEALMFGGWSSLLGVAALWTLGLIAAGLLMRMNSDLATALSFVWLHPYLLIETSAFPLAFAFRNMLLVFGLTATTSFVLGLVIRRRSFGDVALRPPNVTAENASTSSTPADRPSWS